MIRTTTVARRWAAAGSLALVTTIALPAAVSAQDYPSTGSAVFSDTTPDPGRSVTIVGNTTPNTPIIVTLDGGPATGAIVALARAVLGSTESDVTGAFSVTVTVPANLGNGAYTLAVTAGSTVISSTAFIVGSAAPQAGGTPAPAQTQTPAAGAGAQLPVTGGDSSRLAVVGAGFVFIGGLALGGSRLRATD